MGRLSRRRYVGVLGTALTATLAGCGGEEGEILVTNTILFVENGEIVVQVTVENSTSDRQRGTLAVTLSYPPADQQWQATESLSVARGSSPRPEVVFEDAHEEGREFDAYAAEAEFRTDG